MIFNVFKTKMFSFFLLCMYVYICSFVENPTQLFARIACRAACAAGLHKRMVLLFCAVVPTPVLLIGLTIETWVNPILSLALIFMEGNDVKM